MSLRPVSDGVVKLGDPAPWFSGQTIGGARSDLHVNAGRWIVLTFFHDLADPEAQPVLDLLAERAARSGDDQLVVYGIVANDEGMSAPAAQARAPALRLILDHGGAIARRYGAATQPRSVVLDPLLRAIAILPWETGSGHAALLRQLLDGLPSVDDAAGVPLTAPALIIPRVLDFDLCDFLVRLYDKMGGEDSGFLLDSNGKTATVVNHRLKQRRDLLIVVPELRERIRSQIVCRLIPAIERYFQFGATRMDRYLVSCYDSAEGGHFFRHRDNVNAGAEHRRFAVSVNLNRDYDGCDLIFPEFGRRTYRAPVGGAVVFSCGALHEVTPITRGRRYAFLPFLYGEADAALREANNVRLDASSAVYRGGDDLLYPLTDAAE